MKNLSILFILFWVIMSKTFAQNDKYNLIYASEIRLNKSKALIAKKDPDYVSAYNKLIKAADKALLLESNPVVNKTQMPPSGDKHDYLSLAPYFWADSTKSDGLPWKSRDGEVNPLSRGSNTDQTRISDLWDALDALTYGYYFSGDVKYTNKAKELMNVWFIDPKTKVNPNINFGQSVPGGAKGRALGIIEWTGTAQLVTMMQLLSTDKLIDDAFKKSMDLWISDYTNWLLTSPLGIEEDGQPQNHGNWYDFQTVGLLRYLGRNEEAKNRVEAAKNNRIASQIEPDGSQPKELRRTKSISYSEMNVRAMMRVADMGKPLGVDLWQFQTVDGRSLKKAFDYFRPYVLGEKKWEQKQIEGGVDKMLETRLKPLFSIGSSIVGEDLIDKKANTFEKMSYMQMLQYPPNGK